MAAILSQPQCVNMGSSIGQVSEMTNQTELSANEEAFLYAMQMTMRLIIGAKLTYFLPGFITSHCLEAQGMLKWHFDQQISTKFSS